MTLFTNSSLPSEVFQSMQRSFRRNFCGVSSSGNILAQAFIISKFLVKIWWTGDFPQPSASAIYHSNSNLAATEYKRTHTIVAFTLARGGGRPDLASALEASQPSWKHYTHLNTELSFLYDILSIGLLQHLIDFCAILARFQKKFDNDYLLGLFVDVNLQKD